MENYCTYHLNYSKCRELKTICCIKITYLEDSVAINTFKHKIYSCQRTGGSTAFRECPGRKDKTLTAPASGDKPGASVSPAQLSPEAASCPRKTKVYSQAMRKVLPPVNVLISKRNPAVEVPGYTETVIVLVTEDKES